MVEYSCRVLIPGRHHIATLLVRHFHEEVQHQGRHFTEGALRAAGCWIVGGKRVISTNISNCVTCRKLCGKEDDQQMADLPVDRLTVSPSFMYVGLDVFGPWLITSRRTSGGQACNKWWAIFFTCMTSRAIHIEVMESMETSTFISGASLPSEAPSNNSDQTVGQIS